MDLYREPVKNTCPLINDQQEIISDLCRDLEYHSTRTDESNYSELVDMAGICRDQLADVINAFEELRDSNSALRDWGNNLINEISKITEEYVDQISDLEESKNSEINSLEQSLWEVENELEKMKENESYRRE